MIIAVVGWCEVEVAGRLHRVQKLQIEATNRFCREEAGVVEVGVVLKYLCKSFVVKNALSMQKFKNLVRRPTNAEFARPTKKFRRCFE